MINPELLLTKLAAEELRELPCIVHGTYPKPWELIQAQGLKTMTRQHIHFASGLPNGVIISGMRKSASIHIFVDAKKCAEDGIAFYKSDNGVLLTRGVEDSSGSGGDGVLPPKYFSHVTDSSGNVLLDNRKK
ncbi:MAG: hypothetical protein SGILL_008622 [Bacillariaceae sp.]